MCMYIFCYKSISVILYQICKFTHKGFTPPLPTSLGHATLVSPPVRPSMRWDGENPLWVYFHVGFQRILDIYVPIYVKPFMYVYIYI